MPGCSVHRSAFGPERLLLGMPETTQLYKGVMINHYKDSY